MNTVTPALAANATIPPTFDAAAVAEAVASQFGLRGEYAPLVSERDQNFRFDAEDGARYVVKVVGAAEDEVTSAFEAGLLRHLQPFDGVVAPTIVPTINGGDFGEIASASARHRLRVVTWVDGEPLEDQPFDTDTADTFGAALARLDVALVDYSHPGENRLLAWDLQRVGELAALNHHIDGSDTRDAISRAIDDYQTRVLPAKPSLGSQVIHGDANLGNVLASSDGIAFIDFGDSVRAPRVFDLAIAAAYLRPEGDDPAALIAPFVAGYHTVASLDTLELDLLFDLVRARLATTITLLYWRLSARDPDDPYRKKTLELEGGAERFLARLESLGRAGFRGKLPSV